MIFDTREDFFFQLFVDYTLISEVFDGSFAQECLQKLGIKYGIGVEERLRKSFDDSNKKLTAREFSNCITELFNKLGGRYKIKGASEKKVILVCNECLFKHFILKNPALCEVVKGIIGGIAARNFPYCKLEMKHCLNMHDQQCEVVVYLEQTNEAAQSSGQMFQDEQMAYIVTRSQINVVKEYLNHNIYADYLQGFEDLKLTYRDMKTEYNQFREEIFSKLKLGVLIVDRDNNITYLNKTAREILSVQTMWGSSEGAVFQKILAETVADKRFNQQIVQVPCAKELRFYSVNSSPLFDEAGSVSGAVSIFQDVTETKALENELLQIEKFSLVAEVAAGMAHEIRNPMTTLRGFLQLLSLEFQPDAKGFEYCELMIDEIDRANSIIKEFLLLTKPGAPQLIESDLHAILEEIFLLIESKSLLENVELRKQYAKNLPLVKVDPAQIKQVFLNLATNAIQAMPEGGQLMIATQTVAGKAVIAFRDTGCGMEDAQITKIFDPFFTTKEQGTGLGLSISYRIIESHGGRIFVESSRTKGTTFTIELPTITAE